MCSTPKSSASRAGHPLAGDYVPVFTAGTSGLYGVAEKSRRQRSSGDDDQATAPARRRTPRAAAVRSSIWQRIKASLAASLN